MKKWTTLKREYLFRHPWLTVRRDAMQLPNGQILDEYYILEYPAWINVMAITKEGKFVMVRQYRHGLDDIFTELCAGVVENGENPEDAAKRELEEETGYTGGEWSLQCVISANPSTSTNLTYCYLAEGVKLTSGQHLDRTEDIEVILMDKEEVFQMLIDDKMKQALMAAPLWRYFALQGK